MFCVFRKGSNAKWLSVLVHVNIQQINKSPLVTEYTKLLIWSKQSDMTIRLQELEVQPFQLVVLLCFWVFSQQIYPNTFQKIPVDQKKKIYIYNNKNFHEHTLDVTLKLYSPLNRPKSHPNPWFPCCHSHQIKNAVYSLKVVNMQKMLFLTYSACMSLW